MTDFDFTYKSPSTQHKGRLGTLKTPHGSIETPAFIFCATKGAVKGLMPQQLKDAGCQIILSNTYHMLIQPGPDRVHQLGGLQKMTGWGGPMLTDSGGFQIFSLGHGSVASEIKGRRSGNQRKTLLGITEEGATFKSYRDGSTHLLTPEDSIRIQRGLGADLILVLDECTPFHVDKQYTARSMEMSHRWAKRSYDAFEQTHHMPHTPQALYGIVQGGVYEDLRRESTQFVNEMPFFGHAVGGSLGQDKSQMDDIVAMTLGMLSPERPVHLLGIGGIQDIFKGVMQGVDTFDCVHPTRIARHGGALVPPTHWKGPGSPKEHLNLRNKCFEDDTGPIDPGCPCETCKTLSRGALHYLLKAKEMTAIIAITLHNVTFMNRLMTAVRNALKNDTLIETQKEWTF